MREKRSTARLDSPPGQARQDNQRKINPPASDGIISFDFEFEVSLQINHSHSVHSGNKCTRLVGGGNGHYLIKESLFPFGALSPSRRRQLR